MRASRARRAPDGGALFLGALCCWLGLLCWLQESRALDSRGYSSSFQNLRESQDDEAAAGEGANQDEAFSSQLVESLASSASALSSGAGPNGSPLDPQCERITFDFCATRPYNLTRVPNHFSDKNQIEAADRVVHFEALVASRCSRHLLDYLCELLAPMCLDGEANKKYQIYPCRSFCRLVRADCEPQLKELVGRARRLHPQLALSLETAFTCERLLYESNGGVGELHGPCHEAPEPTQAARPAPARPHLQGPAKGYLPYQPGLEEANLPPFITDTAQLDLAGIKPSSSSNRPSPSGAGGPAGEASKPAPGAIQSVAQSVAWTLLRYSNVLSALALLCVLLLLNLNRLASLKRSVGRRLCSSSRKSSSSSSASSSVGSQRKLAASSGAAPGQLAKLSMSPSSSSRSLVLFAGGAGHQHKLLSSKQLIDGAHGQTGAYREQTPPQKLLQRTLINANGTLERVSRYQQLIQQQRQQQIQQQLQLHPQHQYDYIQHDAKQTFYERRNSNQNFSARLESDFESGGSSSGQQRRSSNSRQQNNSSQSRSTLNSAHSKRPQPPVQLYSNILLSSPSHQVLLLGGEHPDDSLPPQPPLPTAAGQPAHPTHSALQGTGPRKRAPAESASAYAQPLAGLAQRSFSRAPLPGPSARHAMELPLGQPQSQQQASSNASPSSSTSSVGSPASSAGLSPAVAALITPFQHQARANLF